MTDSLDKGDRVTIGGVAGVIRGRIADAPGPGFLVRLDTGEYVHAPEAVVRAEVRRASGKILGPDSTWFIKLCEKGKAK